MGLFDDLKNTPAPKSGLFDDLKAQPNSPESIAKQAVFDNPVLSKYLNEDNFEVQFGSPSRQAMSAGGLLETWFPDDSGPVGLPNPNPGKFTIEVFDKSRSVDELRGFVQRDALHVLGERDAKYKKLKEEFAKNFSKSEMDFIRKKFKSSGADKKHSFDEWMNLSVIDGYIRGGLGEPSEFGDIFKSGDTKVYTPAQRRIISKISDYTGIPQTQGSPPDPAKVAEFDRIARITQEIQEEHARTDWVASQIKTAQEATPGDQIEYHPKQKSLQELQPLPPAVPVTAKKTPVIESSKLLIEYAQAKAKESKSPVAIVDQQVRARQVLDAFGGDKKALHAKIRELAKANKMTANESSELFNEIINKASGVPEGVKVGDTAIKYESPEASGFLGGTVAQTKKGETSIGKTKEKTISPLSTLEGLTQFVVSAGGGDLDVTEGRKIASRAGQITGDVAQIASTLGSTVSLGKTLMKSTSKLVQRIGGLMANPDTNPIPDVAYAALSEGDFSEEFIKGYAINLALGRFMGGKGALKAFKNLPEGDRKVMQGFLDEYKKGVESGDIPKVLQKEIPAPVQKELGMVEVPVAKPVKAVDEPVQTELFTDVQKKPKPTTDDVTQVNAKQDIPKASKDDTFETLPAYDRARKAVKDLGKPTVKTIRDTFVRQMVDVSGNLKRELRKKGAGGEKVIDRMEQALGASSKAKVRYEQALEDVYGPIKSEKQKNLVSDYIDHRRTNFLHDNKKAIGDREGLKPDVTTAYFKKLESEHPEVYKQVKEAGDRYFNQMDTLLKDRLDAGLINKATYDELKDNIYSPRVWIQHLEKTEGSISKTLGQGDSGIKSLKEGSDTELVHDLDFLMARSINNAERQIASNNAGKEMYDLMKSGEAGDMLVELKPIFGKDKNIKGWTKPPRGYESVPVMIDGNRVEFGMLKEMADEFVLKDPLLAPQVAKWARILSGNNILKFNATQASTDFPLANVFRDVGTIMFANKEYSNFIPKASVQLGKDVGKVIKDAVGRKGRYLDYINEGGGMDFLMATADTWGKPSRSKLAAPVRGVFEGLRWLGETSEAITRLALRERAMKNYMKQGMSQAEAQVKATIAARRYMDFGQGGSTAKMLDNVLPYFNASIQGHRAWLRGAKNDPVGFASKITQVGGASAALVTYNIVNNPEAWDSVPDRIKSSNWVITTPNYRVDEDGIKEYMYYTIPKPPGISAAFSVFEATAEAAQGRDVPYEQILMGVDDFMAIGSVPPLLGAGLAITGNVDSYTWEQIYRGGRDIEKEAEITRSTPEWAIRAGEITGQSPERLRTAKSKFFTYRNGWYDMSAATIDAMYSQMTDKEINETTEKLATPEGAPGLRRFVRFTSGEVAMEKVGDNMREYNTRRKRQNTEMDKLMDATEVKGLTQEIRDYIKKQPREDQKALRQRALNIIQHKDIPRHFININYITSASPETKAKSMFDEWQRADDDEKKKIDRYIHRIKGMDSPRFMRVYREMKRESKAN